MSLIKNKKIIILDSNSNIHNIKNNRILTDIDNKLERAVSRSNNIISDNLLPSEQNIPIIKVNKLNQPENANETVNTETNIKLKPNEKLNPITNEIYDKDKFVLYTDGQMFELHDISELPNFEVRPGMKVRIPPNRLNIKCPFRCKEGYRGKKGWNIITFTQNITDETCCGVTYFK
jgi:hypothetical protein